MGVYLWSNGHNVLGISLPNCARKSNFCGQLYLNCVSSCVDGAVKRNMDDVLGRRVRGRNRSEVSSRIGR